MIDQDKPRINWDRIGPKTAVWCATEEEASEFVQAAHERGCHWSGSVPDGCLCRGAGRDTVYYIRDGCLMWSSRSAAMSYVDAVVNFSDLLEAASSEAQDGRPRFTEKEMEQAGAMEILFGTGASIHREESGLLYVRNAPANYHIPIGLFPSLHPGQSIALKGLIG